MEPDLSTWGVIICLPLVLIFGIVAILNARHIYQDYSIVFDLTARDTMDASLIGLSFLGTSVGAWVFFWPAVMIADPIEGAGALGLLSLSFSFLGAILMFSWLGSLIREKYPDAISLGQFAEKRFGYSAQIFVTAV
jgi:SSS family solute:Na+ symporter